MERRGQATLFIVLGIVLVIAVILFFVLRQADIIPPLLTPSTAESELRDIDEHIVGCLDEIGTDYVTIIGLQGGYLSPGPDTFRLYADSPVSYLCWDQEDVPTCTNRFLTLNRMEEQLQGAINEALETCINVYDYSNNVQPAAEWELEVSVDQDAVVLDLFYPVDVTKGDNTAFEDEFSHALDIPLGELYDVSQDIVNEHAVIGDFDPLLYMLEKLSRYTIVKNKPYPDVIYQVQLREGDYLFQFGIQGEENV